jgi:hypothetical protein
MRHGIHRSTVSRTAWYPTQHGLQLRTQRALLLFPSEDAISVGDFIHRTKHASAAFGAASSAEGSNALHIVVLDGTWKQVDLFDRLKEASPLQTKPALLVRSSADSVHNS